LTDIRPTNQLKHQQHSHTHRYMHINTHRYTLKQHKQTHTQTYTHRPHHHRNNTQKRIIHAHKEPQPVHSGHKHAWLAHLLDIVRSGLEPSDACKVCVRCREQNVRCCESGHAEGVYKFKMTVHTLIQHQHHDTKHTHTRINTHTSTHITHQVKQNNIQNITHNPHYYWLTQSQRR